MQTETISDKSSERVRLEPEWKAHLGDEFDKSYMKDLSQFLKSQVTAKKVIYPRGDEIFSALNTTPFSKVKVVIVGQDPYHGPGQAHGLSFSVKPGIPIPPSLMNIFKEMKLDLKIEQPRHGYLKAWAEQGVLLLNSILSVEGSKPASHQNRGWETFTDKVLSELNEHRDGLVFLLWGSYAQKKGAFLDTKRHLVLKAPHPSPLSAHRGFLGSKHFSLTNDYLVKNNKTPIEWKLPPLS